MTTGGGDESAGVGSMDEIGGRLPEGEMSSQDLNQ